MRWLLRTGLATFAPTFAPHLITHRASSALRPPCAYVMPTPRPPRIHPSAPTLLRPSACVHLPAPTLRLRLPRAYPAPTPRRIGGTAEQRTEAAYPRASLHLLPRSSGLSSPFASTSARQPAHTVGVLGGRPPSPHFASDLTLAALRTSPSPTTNTIPPLAPFYPHRYRSIAPPNYYAHQN